MTLIARLKNVCLIAVLILLSVPLNSVAAEDAINADSYQISDLKWQQNTDSWVCQIYGDRVPAYTMYELFSPHRLIIDIASGNFAGSINFPIKVDKGPVTLIKGAVLTDQNPAVARIELLLADDRPYSVTSSGNDILVQFENDAQAPAATQSKAPERLIKDINVDWSGSMTKVQLLADGPIQKYQSTELAKGKDHPARLIVDLPGIATQGHAIPTNDASPISLVRTESYKDGARVILDSATDDLFRYSIAVQQDGLLINVEPAADATPLLAEITGLSTAEIAQGSPALSSAAKTAATAPSSQGAEKKPAASVTKSSKSAAKDGKTDFAFAGYTEQRISVDFYKIDLHNVFRLIGEISGRNIVVDEKVSGSLTLALNDVPWDFVLDVILNLKNLAKEERFNTIVISQKSDSFAWPQRTEEALAIKKEAISVTKRMEVPKEKLEARKYISQAKNLEDAGNYAEAVTFYEKAFQSWPENGDLAKRITYLSLVKLGLNAKAAHYGKIASKLLPHDPDVALQTALSLANMEMVKEAKSYFDFAVSCERPSRQALASYAAFSEQNSSNEMALSLLERFEQIYGTSLETLVSKARIYDKMGDAENASKEYQTILLSGYKVPADLEKYIKERLHR
ncbi:MAG: AMIN domain-containing protein [Desulfobulbaceae bacterium]|nr:AMIN domain-containing protein [Desulfobulbaceae bacterium]